jgi:levanase/fructan beta-fructosidase
MSVLLQDHRRGTYHFSPRHNWMNDPNGMVYFNGEYHLFYQHHPNGTTWGPMHWGHAVSRDLLAWEELPIALAPDEHGMIFSGSAVVDWNDTTGFFGGKPGLVAIFTHHSDVPGAEHPVQSQSLAYSADQGRTWTKFVENPVLRHDSYIDFRDPKVFWHEPTSQWIMILACGQSVSLYRSPNLKAWTLASEFGEGIGFHGGVWECPDLFPLPVEGEPGSGKWVMLVSIGDAPDYEEGSRTQYFTGDFDGERFMPDAYSQGHVRWLDYGRDNYAGVSWSDVPAADGRRLFIGWMSNWKYANQTPTDGWRGAMTIARELQLIRVNGETVLTQQPVRELKAYRKPVLTMRDAKAKDVSVRLAGLRLDAFEIHARAGFAEAQGSFAWKVRTGAEQETVIGYDAEAGEVYVDRRRSGIADFHPQFAGRHAASLRTGAESLELRIFVDKSSVEVFVNGGESVLTDLIYPDPNSAGLSLQTVNERLTFDAFDLFEIAVPAK